MTSEYAVRPRSRHGLGTAALLSAIGLFVVSLAGRVSADHPDAATSLFWIGLVVAAVPFAVVAVRPASPRGFRIGALVLLTAALFLVRVMFEPLRFQGVDELQQLRSVLDIMRTGHLFEDNPLVSSYPQFPGLLLVTDAVTRLSGCSTYVAGLVVVASARLVLVLALFRIGEAILGSPRRAAIVVLVYLCNPNFVFFGTEFGYESFALPLAVAALFATSRIGVDRADQELPAHADRILAGVLAVVLCAAVVVSHHMTAVWLTVELLLWLGLSLLFARGRPHPALWPAVVSVVLSAVWLGVVARDKIADELGPTVHSSWESLVDLVTGGGGGAKRPFSGAPQQQVDPVALRIFGFASVLLLLGLLLVGAVRLIRRRVRSPFLLALAIPAVLFPAMLALRLTSASTETASRSAEFVFFGLAVLAGLVVRLRAPTVIRPVRSPNTPALAGVAAFVVLLVGGVVIGTATYDRFPRAYRPSANGSSITVPGLLAAQWAGRELPRDSYVVSDQANRLLMGSYGGLHPQLGLANSVPVGHLLLDPRLSAEAVAVVQVDKVAYVVADDRLTRALPGTGNYVDGSEPDAGHHETPVAPSALTKFDDVRGVSRIYDNGIIRIYDVRALQRSPAP